MKNAKNSPLKGEKCKEFTLKGWKVQRIYPQRVKIAKNSLLKGKKNAELTLKERKI